MNPTSINPTNMNPTEEVKNYIKRMPIYIETVTQLKIKISSTGEKNIENTVNEFAERAIPQIAIIRNDHVDAIKFLEDYDQQLTIKILKIITSAAEHATNKEGSQNILQRTFIHPTYPVMPVTDIDNQNLKELARTISLSHRYLIDKSLENLLEHTALANRTVSIRNRTIRKAEKECQKQIGIEALRKHASWINSFNGREGIEALSDILLILQREENRALRDCLSKMLKDLGDGLKDCLESLAVMEKKHNDFAKAK